MDSCNGDGSCLEQDDECFYQRPEVRCEHNCSPKQCPNFSFCKQNGPEWLLNCHSGFCINCNITIGRIITYTEDVQECVVCTKEDNLMILDCNHSICKKCFRKMNYIENDEEPPENLQKCPLCRSKPYVPEWSKNTRDTSNNLYDSDDLE